MFRLTTCWWSDASSAASTSSFTPSSVCDQRQFIVMKSRSMCFHVKWIRFLLINVLRCWQSVRLYSKSPEKAEVEQNNSSSSDSPQTWHTSGEDVLNSVVKHQSGLIFQTRRELNIWIKSQFRVLTQCHLVSDVPLRMCATLPRLSISLITMNLKETFVCFSHPALIFSMSLLSERCSSFFMTQIKLLSFVQCNILKRVASCQDRFLSVR